MRLDLSDQAIADLHAIADVIAVDSLAAADRFLVSAHATARSLLRFPHRGRPRLFRLADLKGTRSLAVIGFPKHLLFYRVEGTRLVVARVLHGSMDLRRRRNTA